MKTALIIIGIIIFVTIAAFLYLIIAGADQSRWKDIRPEEKETNEKDIDGV